MAEQTSIGANDGIIQTQQVASSTGPFAVDFPFFHLNDVIVVVTPDGGDPETLVRGVDYTLSATANGDGIYPSGTVTLAVAVANTLVTRYRRTSLVRTSQLPKTGLLSRDALNADLNRMMAAMQDLERRMGLYLQFPESEAAGQVLPNLNERAGKAFVWDADGQAAAGTLSATNIVFNSFMTGTFFPSSTAAQARSAIGAAGTGADNTLSGTNTVSGSLAVPNQAAGTDSTQAANTAFVQDAVGRVYVQLFDADGTYTPAAGMVKAIIECVGAGGGGGGIDGDGNAMSAGGGGGGGYSMRVVTAAMVGASQAVTIGAGGNGGAAGNNDGSAGSNTSVGTLCVANGGSGGEGMGPIPDTAQGGMGGIVTGAVGNHKTTGSPGGCGSYIVFASGLGSAANGGSSAFGGGGRGRMADGSSTAGGNGQAYGGGGAGAASRNDTGSAAGGNGAAGFVRITEFCNQ